MRGQEPPRGEHWGAHAEDWRIHSEVAPRALEPVLRGPELRLGALLLQTRPLSLLSRLAHLLNESISGGHRLARWGHKGDTVDVRRVGTQRRGGRLRGDGVRRAELIVG